MHLSHSVVRLPIIPLPGTRTHAFQQISACQYFVPFCNYTCVHCAVAVPSAIEQHVDQIQIDMYKYVVTFSGSRYHSSTIVGHMMQTGHHIKNSNENLFYAIMLHAACTVHTAQCTRHSDIILIPFFTQCSYRATLRIRKCVNGFMLL